MKNQEPKYETRKCPFYGFAYHDNIKSLIDKGNNECALLSDIYGYVNCKIDISPCWETCELNRTNKLNSVFLDPKQIRVFPKEKMSPEYIWRGISLEEWLSFVKDSQV